MKSEQCSWRVDKGWEIQSETVNCDLVQLVLVFGAHESLRKSEFPIYLKQRYPNALITGCSTAGEIQGACVLENSVVATAIQFEKTTIRAEYLNMAEYENNFIAGKRLIENLEVDKLVHVMVFSKGLNVNGSELARGLSGSLVSGVKVTGGLAGDGADFRETSVIWDGELCSDGVVAIGFYGKSLKVGYGTLGGWDSFGPERLITSAEGSVLYELDDQPALELYKRYLGDDAADLPASGLLFPLSIRDSDNESLVRTILAVSEEDQSITFAGEMRQGTYARFMKANFERLIDGAVGAAQSSSALIDSSAELAVLISCAGRKMVLQQRVEEETEGVRSVLGDTTVLTGFYSYGELSPLLEESECKLHNQTMTITTFKEI